MRRKVLWAGALFILALGFLVVYRVRAQRLAFADAPPPPVQAVAVEAARTGTLVETLNLTGTVIYPSEVRLSAKVLGTLESLYVEEGQSVRRGEPIAVIDHRELDAQLAQVRAAARAARANLDLALRGAQEEQILQARAALKQAEANYTQAQSDHRRFKELYDLQAITHQQFEMAATRLQVAQEQLTGARAALKQLQVGTRPEQIAALRAQWQGAEASVGLIEAQIANHTVRAPISGRITQKYTEIGTLVSPSVPLVSLGRTDRPQIEVPVPETELRRLRLGQRVAVRAPVLGNTVLTGKVATISPVVDPQARLVKVKVNLLPSPALGRLRGGMLVDTAVEIFSHGRSILVPTNALNLDPSGRVSVFVVEGGNRAREKAVTVIARQPLLSAVRGLPEKERVIVTGNAFIKDGDTVTVQPALKGSGVRDQGSGQVGSYPGDSE